MFRPALYFPKREMSMWPVRKRGKSVRAIQAELGSARLCRRGAREAGCRSWRADLGFKMVGNARGSANTTRTSVFVYNHAYGVLAGAAGKFSVVGDYTTKFKSPNQFRAFSRLPVGPVLAGLRGFASRASSLTFPCLWPPTASLFSVILYLPCERARGHFLYWCGFRSGQLWLATPE